MEKLKIAIIGQSQFAAEVYKKVKTNGHEVVGVFTIPDKNNREDPVAAEAAKGSPKTRQGTEQRRARGATHILVRRAGAQKIMENVAYFKDLQKE